jgi:hypothetical protein
MRAGVSDSGLAVDCHLREAGSAKKTCLSPAGVNPQPAGNGLEHGEDEEWW